MRRRNVWQHAQAPSSGPTQAEIERKRAQLRQTPTRDQMERLTQQAIRQAQTPPAERKPTKRGPGRPPSTRKCSDPTCGRKHHGQGLCQKHYMRAYRRRRRQATGSSI